MERMYLVQTDDFETVKSKYIDVIENTPDIEKYARWIYGKHPTDELLKAYIDHEELYFLTNGRQKHERNMEADTDKSAFVSGNDRKRFGRDSHYIPG